MTMTDPLTPVTGWRYWHMAQGGYLMDTAGSSWPASGITATCDAQRRYMTPRENGQHVAPAVGLHLRP